MTFPLSPKHTAELSGDVREPRYMVEIDFPSGLVMLTTGDPAKVDTDAAQWGAVTHGFVSVEKLSVESVQLIFLLGDSSFISDFFSTSLGNRVVRVWSYYEFDSPTLVTRCDAKPEHSGKISRVSGGMKTAKIDSIQPVYNFPTSRINPTGGFNWITTPKVLSLGNNIITVQRRGLR